MRIWLRLYEELNDHLPPAQRKTTRAQAVAAGATVADALRAAGVPASAVDLVLVNGTSVPADQRLAEDDRLAVYPVFEALDVGPLARLPGRPLRRLRFAVTPALAGLGERLRAHGWDVTVAERDSDEALARFAAAGRVLLVGRTDRAIGDGVMRLYRVRAATPAEQWREVLQRFQLGRAAPEPAGEA